jgi:ABC-type phosphate transport system ATPase subunit
MCVVEVKDLSLVRGGQQVLHGVNFQLAAGEILLLIGPSGSGKSSVLRCLNRLEEPSPGTVFLKGEDITTLEVVTLRRRVGTIFQKTAVFDGTVGENIAYGPALCSQGPPRERIEELLNLVALERDLIDKPAAELSGGQEQRMAIARALANEPEVLLLDEPTSALDPIATRHVEESMLRLRDRLNLSMVWVSHHVEQARRVGDRVILLEDGRVVSTGDAAAMLDTEHGDARVIAFANGREEPTPE